MRNPSPATIREACRDPFYAEALEQLVEKASPREVIEDLMARGLAKEEAQEVTKESAIFLSNAGQGVGAPDIIRGGILIAIGLGVTLLTYILASEGGGIFFVCYGAVIAGVVSISKGLRLRKSNTRGFLRNMIHNAIRAAADDSTQKADAQESAGAQEPGKEARNRRLYDY